MARMAPDPGRTYQIVSDRVPQHQLIIAEYRYSTILQLLSCKILVACGTGSVACTCTCACIRIRVRCSSRLSTRVFNASAIATIHVQPARCDAESRTDTRLVSSLVSQ